MFNLNRVNLNEELISLVAIAEVVGKQTYMGVCKAGQVSFWPVTLQVKVSRCQTFTCQAVRVFVFCVTVKGVPITLTCFFEDSKNMVKWIFPQHAA